MSFAGEIFSELLLSMEQSGQKFASLYVSCPYSNPSLRELERFLAEDSAGNALTNSTCDGVCQIKSSLLEGVLVVSSCRFSLMCLHLCLWTSRYSFWSFMHCCIFIAPVTWEMYCFRLHCCCTYHIWQRLAWCDNPPAYFCWILFWLFIFC